MSKTLKYQPIAKVRTMPQEWFSDGSSLYNIDPLAKDYTLFQRIVSWVIDLIQSWKIKNE